MRAEGIAFWKLCNDGTVQTLATGLRDVPQWFALDGTSDQ